MYAIELTSDFAELSRYDFVVTCAGFSAAGEELYVEGCEGMLLRCEAADSIKVIIYAVTNKLPKDRIVLNSPPFFLDVVVTRFGEIIYNQAHEVNQWGGASITIKL